jgi:hypothetical protein
MQDTQGPTGQRDDLIFVVFCFFFVFVFFIPHMAYSLLPTCLHACAVGTHLQTRRRREFPRPAVSMAVLLQEVGSKQNIAAVVRTDRPRSFIIMQVELVSGPAGS